MSLLIGVAAGSPPAFRSDNPPPPQRIPSKYWDDDRPNSKEMEEESESELEVMSETREFVEESPEVDEPEADELETFTIGSGIGSMGRVSHLAGKTFGRNDSVTPLEFMPYLLTDEHFVFADLRGFITNRSQVGGNLGLGYRRLYDDWNAWTGASIWYDADQSSSKLFQQIGLSFEGLIQQFEFRSNMYLPFTSSQVLSNSISSSIVGNQLLYSRSIDVGSALRGVDAEVGYSLPILDRHLIRGFVGGYHFEGAGAVNGFKARIEGVINHAVTGQLLYTHDRLYGDNLMVGLSMQFPFGKDHPTTGWTRNTPSPFRFVERNYNVIVARSQNDTSDQIATDPNTGNPYFIEQVNASPANPSSNTADGTSAHPFSSIAAAQAAGGNVFIVQNGSILDQPITLTSGQYLLGQGAATTLPTTGGFNIPIPNLLPATQQTSPGATPMIQNVAGDAITLASHTEVAGFNITGSTGNGISGNGVTGVSLHDLTFSSIGGDAIHLTNSSGKITMSGIQVTSATGNGVVFDGGNPDITFSNSGNTISVQRDGFVLNSLAGGIDTISGLSLVNTGGNGLAINNVATNVTFDALNVTNSGTNGAGGSAVAISGVTGATQVVNGVAMNNRYQFTGTTNITSPAAAGFSVSGTDTIVKVTDLNVTSSSPHPATSVVNATSPVTFGSLSINTQNATGFYALNAADLVISGGRLTTINAPAIDIASSGINAALNSVSVNQGPFGIRLVGSTGAFSVLGDGGYSTGGTIQNTTTAGVLINSFGGASFSSIDFVNNAVAVQSKGSSQLTLSNLRISGSTGYAIDSVNDGMLIMGGSILSSNGVIGGGTMRISANTAGTFTSLIQSNTFIDTNGSAIQFLTVPAGVGASLNTQLSSNSITGYRNGAALVTANWNGPVVATINNNVFYQYGSDMTALSLETPSSASPMNLTINTNTFDFQGAGATSGTGIWIIDGQSGQTSTGGSTLSVTSNTIIFQGAGSTGLRFGLYRASADTITGNIITDQAGGATGMLFDDVASGTQTVIAGNAINLLPGDVTTHRGIIFSQVSPGFALYTPFNSTTNTITNAASQQMEFSIPASSPGPIPANTVNGILINGTTIMQPQ